jgi:hypothetical protein
LQQVLSFAQECLRQSAKFEKLTVPAYASTLLETSDSESRDSLTTFQKLIETAFEINVSELQSTASAALVQLVRARPQLFGPLYSKRLDWLKKFLLGGLTETRRRIAQLLGLICAEMPLDTVTQLIVQLSAIIDSPTLALTLTSSSSSSSLSTSSASTAAPTSAAQVAASINHSDTVHGAILGLGVLVARCIPEIETSVCDTLCCFAVVPIRFITSLTHCIADIRCSRHCVRYWNVQRAKSLHISMHRHLSLPPQQPCH